ncbi:MAG: hypothetical protein WDZ96_00155 [Acidimicrobiia bacterium]
MDTLAILLLAMFPLTLAFIAVSKDWILKTFYSHTYAGKKARDRWLEPPGWKLTDEQRAAKDRWSNRFDGNDEQRYLVDDDPV